MAVELLKPRRGGFLRPIALGLFIRDYLLGRGPMESDPIDPHTGSYQADIFHAYKIALIKATAVDRATRIEERRAKKEGRRIAPEKIDELTQRLIARMPYKANGCRYHSFVVYFSMLQRLGWVEPTGQIEPSAFQVYYPSGQPKKYFRITSKGGRARVADWANPHAALYGRKP